MAGDSYLEIDVGTYALEFGKKNLRKSLRVAGREVIVVARKKIRSASGTGRLYYAPKGTVRVRGGSPSKGGAIRYRASAPGQAPVNVTGETAGSLRVMSGGRNKDSVRLFDAAFQAKILETGAVGGRPGRANSRSKGKHTSLSSGRVMKPRPFLTTALAEKSADISRRLSDAAIRDVVLQRVKS